MKSKYIGLVLLWISVLIFSSASSVIDKIVTLGSNNLINDHNPISFCNVLFVGNLMAGIVFFIVYRKRFNLKTIKAIEPKQWRSLSIMTIVTQIIGPTFYFFAIMTAQVINVILISTTEVAWALLLGYLFFKEKPSKIIILSTIIAVIGVVVTFYLYLGGVESLEIKKTITNYGMNWLSELMESFPKSGELFAILGAFFSVLGDMLSKKTSTTVPESIYTIFITFAAAIMFFVFTVSLFGIQHFADLFSPFLWKWMLVYGGIIVALGAYTFVKSIQIVGSSEIAIAFAFSPVAGVFFAYLIVGEVPDNSQLIGGSIILVGILIGLFENLKSQKVVKEGRCGFKGI